MTRPSYAIWANQDLQVGCVTLRLLKKPVVSPPAKARSAIATRLFLVDPEVVGHDWQHDR